MAVLGSLVLLAQPLLELGATTTAVAPVRLARLGWIRGWLQISDMCHWHAIGHGISNQRRKALEEKKKCLSFFSFRQELSQE